MCKFEKCIGFSEGTVVSGGTLTDIDIFSTVGCQFIQVISQTDALFKFLYTSKTVITFDQCIFSGNQAPQGLFFFFNELTEVKVLSNSINLLRSKFFYIIGFLHHRSNIRLIKISIYKYLIYFKRNL